MIFGFVGVVRFESVCSDGFVFFGVLGLREFISVRSIWNFGLSRFWMVIVFLLGMSWLSVFVVVSWFVSVRLLSSCAVLVCFEDV